MGFTLSNGRVVGYSPRERDVFAALVKADEAISTERLSEIVFSGDPRFHARTLLSGALRSLVKKVEANNEPFSIMTTGRAGPNSMKVWIQKRS